MSQEEVRRLNISTEEIKRFGLGQENKIKTLTRGRGSDEVCEQKEDEIKTLQNQISFSQGHPQEDAGPSPHRGHA